jgi:hypothetical protein
MPSGNGSSSSSSLVRRLLVEWHLNVLAPGSCCRSIC